MVVQGEGGRINSFMTSEAGFQSLNLHTDNLVSPVLTISRYAVAHEAGGSINQISQVTIHDFLGQVSVTEFAY